jgi:hypothetical protein
MTSPVASLEHLIETDLGVGENYLQVPKHVTPGEPLQLSGALLKWYEVHLPDQPVPSEIVQLARNYLSATSLEARGLGFVILHRCGESFYFLIVCTWRNSNEIWKTVFYKDGEAMPEFALFPREGDHRPMLCVWEMVPTWHEQKAWVRFLTSSRDEVAGRQWLDDRFSGDT